MPVWEHVPKTLSLVIINKSSANAGMADHRTVTAEIITITITEQVITNHPFTEY